MSQIWIIMYFSDAFQIEEISINKNDYELLKFLTVDCMCFCSKRELLHPHWLAGTFQQIPSKVSSPLPKLLHRASCSQAKIQHPDRACKPVRLALPSVFSIFLPRTNRCLRLPCLILPLDLHRQQQAAIPVLNKNICGKRLNFFIFRNHFIYTDFFYLGSVGKVHDYPNFDSFFHRNKFNNSTWCRFM